MALQWSDINPGSYEDEIRENYDRLRQERGWDWETLAVSLDRQNEPTLAEWARSNKTPAPRKESKGVERATSKPSETR